MADGTEPTTAPAPPGEPSAELPVPAPQADRGDPARELRALLETQRGKRHVVAIQDYPDPDAISSAMAYREIAREFEIEVDIVYEGLISHPENLALVNLLEVELTQYAEGHPLDVYDGAVFVDNQGTTSRLTGRLKQQGVPTLAVIDHHDPQEALDPLFRDVRPLGAAATMFSEYLQSGVFFEMDTTNQAHANLATALMHGLYSETRGFVVAGRAEFRAAAFLCGFVDADLLERVLCVQKSRGTMDVIQTSLARRVIRGGLSLAGVGFVRWADRDAIPQAADFLLTEENVHTAIVYGLVSGEDGREVVAGSLRTTNATMGVDAFLKKALGKDIRGKPFGGGRSRAGGFEIDTGFLASANGDRREREAKWALYDRQVRRKLFYAAGLESDKSDDELEERVERVERDLLMDE